MIVHISVVCTFYYWIVFHFVNKPQFVYLVKLDGYLGAMSMLIQILLWTHALIFLFIPSSELLGLGVDAFLIFETVKSLSSDCITILQSHQQYIRALFLIGLVRFSAKIINSTLLKYPIFNYSCVLPTRYPLIRQNINNK